MKHCSPLTLLRLVLSLALSLAAPAQAGIYKCAGENGTVVYQDSPCPQGKALRDLEADPATVSVVPGTRVPRAATKPAPAPKQVQVRTAKAKVRSRGGDPAERKFVRVGMTQAEVLYRIGRPDMEGNSRRKEGRQWSYLPTAGDADTLTIVIFNGGAVARVERKVVR